MADGIAERREWAVTGMDCAACTRKVTGAVSRLPGVSEVRVALLAERLTALVEPDAAASVEAAVRGLGYGISSRSAAGAPPSAGPDRPQPGGHGDRGEDPACDGSCAQGHTHHHRHADREAGAPGRLAGVASAHAHAGPADPPWHRARDGQTVIMGGLLLAAAWATSLALPAPAGDWAFAAACLIGLAPVARRAWAALRMGQPFTIESLMTLAAAGALAIGEAAEAALVVFLFGVGELLEGVAAGRARSGIRALAALVPRTARVEENGSIREVAAGTLAIGQVVLARPGDRIPADGEIVEGRSGVDESPVTGESLPRSRGPGDPVFAGSVNTEALLRIRVSRAAADNTIARILRLVEEAEEARAPTERFIDRFSRWYMPAVVALAAAIALVPPLGFGAPWETWIYRGLALLLIGCPCALVISVPASITAALSAGARRGLLMKGGAVIEAAARVREVAFDKTGTLTEGRPEVTDLLPLGQTDAARLLAVAAAVEAGSSHPLARAVLQRAADSGVAPPHADEAASLPGRGATARIGGGTATVASLRHAAEAGVLDAAGAATAEELEAQGKSVVAVWHRSAPLGLIAFRDEPRPDAGAALRQLAGLGLRTTILTGDNSRTAAAIGSALGISWRAGMLPEDKLAAIRELGRQGVMMVGDGINDAPALKQATVGVAMGSGTDVALETADAAILRNRVSDVAALIRLSRTAMGNIRQNVAIALGLKAVFLVTSVLGLTGLWLAVLADTGATVLVTANALRLLRHDPTRAG